MASNSKNLSIPCHVLLLGDVAVGKTCIINQKCKGTFSDYTPTTGGYASEPTKIQICGIYLQVVFMDTGGLERYDSHLPMIYQKAGVFVLVYDITRRSSYERLQKWMDDIHKYKKDDGIKIMVIGNKVDLNNREVSFEDGLEFARKKQTRFFETSAKTGQNIHEAFQYMVNELINIEEFSLSEASTEKPLDIPHRKWWQFFSFSSSNQLRATHSISNNVIVMYQKTERISFISLESSFATSCTDKNVQDYSVLRIEHLYLVRREIDELPSWIDVGLELGLLINTLRKISDNEKTLGDRTREMLVAWLEQQDQVSTLGEPSWKQLVNALTRHKYKSKAEAIKRKYLPWR